MKKGILLGSILIICLFIGINIYNKLTYVGENIDPFTYFDEFAGNTYNLVYEDTRIDLTEPIMLKDDTLYVRYDFANTYVSDKIYYDPNEQVMTLTNAAQVIRLREGENKITYGDVSGTYTLYTDDNGLYISANLLEDLFKVHFQAGEDGKLYAAMNGAIQQEMAEVSRKTSLRTHPQNKSKVVEILKKNSKVYIYEIEGEFARVRSEEGFVGYVKTSTLKQQRFIEPAALPQVNLWDANPLGEDVRLIWDQLTRKMEVNWSDNKYSRVTGANVISPTWFEFGNEAGDLISRATTSYVEQAHDKGLEVWPLMSHSFTDSALTETILKSTAKRQHVIDQLIDAAKLYGFDGVNIDIENIQAETSAAWVQFMRELYPQLKKEGLKVSVDVYMPSSWSSHYERAKVAESCDYFIVMAYDQHWSGSTEAGSVSEIPWVEQGINNTLLEVPADKLVLGIPFYTRRWLENDEGLSSKSYSMASIKSFIASWDIEPILDEASGQHYVESHREEGTYKIWLEDYMSVSKRMELVHKYNLAGFAAWRLGLETPDIWEALKPVS